MVASGARGGVVLVPLAEGFEEIEAVVVIDVLRRAEIEVRVAGLVPGPVRGAHGITLATDCALDEVDAGALAMIVLPGGMPGTTNLKKDARILALVRALEGSGRFVAAICAAPTVLAEAGVLAGRRVTAYPSVRAQLTGAEVVDRPGVVRSGPVITSQGVGTALEFALELVAELAGPARARELRAALLVPESY
ncbi:MAG: DJ-1/PfpI family protein [Planctomycetes bacterium]|nr:DJ-1/PfpI family protein [Planctomycetota bacterium]